MDLARDPGTICHSGCLRGGSAMDVHDLREQEQGLGRALPDGLGRMMAGLTTGPGTARARLAGQPDLRELLLCPPRE